MSLFPYTSRFCQLDFSRIRTGRTHVSTCPARTPVVCTSTHTGDRNREQHVRKTTHSLSRVCETIHLCELHDLTHLRRACEYVRRLAAEERRTPAGLSHLNRAQQPIDKSHTALQTLCPSKPAPASGHRPTRCARVPFISGRGNYHYASCI